MLEPEAQNPKDINPVRDWCLEYAKDGDLFVDCGAHIGRCAVPVAEKGVKVVAIEACPESADILRQNLNDFKNATVIEKLLWNDEGERKFTVPLGSHIQSSVFDRFSKNREKVRTEKLPTTTLHKILQDFPDGEVVIKMDCELSEFFIWQGLGESKPRVKAVCMEFMPTILKADAGVDPKKFIEIIENDGFEVFDLNGEKLHEHDLYYPHLSKVDLYLKRK